MEENEEKDGLLLLTKAEMEKEAEASEQFDNDNNNSTESAVPAGAPRKRKVKVHLHRDRTRDSESTEGSHYYFRVRNGVIDIYPPWKEITRGFLFFVAGSVLVYFARLAQTEKIKAEPGSDIALYVLGSLLFLPGFYVLVLTYKAWRGYPGYTYDCIPHD